MKFAEKYLLLRSVPPFDSLDADAAAAVAQVCFVHSFKPCATIASAKSLPTHLFAAFRGSIEYRGENVKIFEPHRLVDLCEFDDCARADASTGAECLVISREHFIGLARNYPDILVKLYNKGNAAGGAL